MVSNSIGRNYVVTLFGESHGKGIGVVVDGCPPGLPLSEEDIQTELNRRRPTSAAYSTSRREEDKVNILSGVFQGRTTGAPLCLFVWNKEYRSEAYEEFRWKPRPGHADYPAFVKYRGFHDHRGGGIFSSRMTVGMVAAGAVAKRLLGEAGIGVYAHTVEIAGVKIRSQPTVEEIREKAYSNPLRCVESQTAEEMEKKILQAKSEGDTVGGVVECIATGVPPGVGDPIFYSLDADIAKYLFFIPAVKGVEFGAGFQAARLRGSENNDPYRVVGGKVVALTNNAGGILGGLSNGMPIAVRAAFKPPSSIFKRQKTVDLRTMEDAELEVKGRYDSCVVPRAVPIVEALVACVLADHLLPLGILGKPAES
ncbi:chorismate synthase [Candidatus Hecatella orcuttiae]|uniref:chorismate synthase n=1 Tax=Candidatus Hecatella orcuttiae TaxID=1935119 RepID=UPI0028681D68|nr:chorismate synthase [Candidatus Hecatella orcuttiae]